MLCTIQRAILLVLSVFLVAGSGCIFSPEKGGGGGGGGGGETVEYLPNTSPENLIANLQSVYNDRTRSAAERHAIYQDLFPDVNETGLEFLFHFQPVDVEPGEEASWGLSSELQAHENMFAAQDRRDIYSLELTIQHQPPVDLEFPEPGQEDWKLIFATNVQLRLMFNPNDGLMVDGGQAEFLCAPANDRWYIAEWKDLPRP